MCVGTRTGLFFPSSNPSLMKVMMGLRDKEVDFLAFAHKPRI